MHTKSSRIEAALEIADLHGGADNPTWVIDQMVRALLRDAESYAAWIEHHRASGRVWYEGVAP